MTEDSNSSGSQGTAQDQYGRDHPELYPDMPITAGNFQKLVEKGFLMAPSSHRIIDGFMIQGEIPPEPVGAAPAMPSRTSSPARTKTTGAPSAWPMPGPTLGAASSSSTWWTTTFSGQGPSCLRQSCRGMEVVDAMGRDGPMDRPVKEVKIESAKVVA